MTTDDEARKARNEYMRNWRKNNKDKVKATQERYWLKKASEAQKADDDKKD